jgi:hypothetical protein
MKCSIKRFKCDTYPEKVVNTENVKQMNTDLAKLMAERNRLDNKYFPTVCSSVSGGTVASAVITHKKDKTD